MLTRRIVIGACALCLAIPAAAGASEGKNPPRDGTAPTGAPSTVTAKGLDGNALGGPPSTPYGNPAAGTPSNVRAKGPYGIPATGRKSTVKAKGPYGTATGPRSAVQAKGPFGIPATGPKSTVKAKGPYGVPASPGSPSTVPASVLARRTPLRDEASGWRTAAISEAALLAALFLGSALVLPARRRAAHTAT
jgi:hypothetical protein